MPATPIPDYIAKDPHYLALLATVQRLDLQIKNRGGGDLGHRTPEPNPNSAPSTTSPTISWALNRLPRPSSSSKPIYVNVIDDSSDDSEGREYLRDEKARKDARRVQRRAKREGKKRSTSPSPPSPPPTLPLHPESWATDEELDALMATVSLNEHDAVVHSRPSTPPNPKPSPGSPTSYHVASPSRIGAVDNWHTAGNLTQGVPGARVRRTAAAVASPKKPKAKAYVVYQGRDIGVFTKWDPVERSTLGISAAVYESFPDILYATRSWLLALRMKVVRILAADVAYPPCEAFLTPVVEALLTLPEDHFGQRFYVVSQGKCPGVYPFWGLAGSQVKLVPNAICKQYLSREEALAAWQRAHDEGVVRAL
ncbi:hypothetical protein FIBSPDRAFT_961317 [Athelia psychrophila]|uniref:Ribonuclease H1 N-terminal domain-containing protein n=1 Tax=Athelia psychrophila TaxID=1759441 RepID=A0A166BBU9_9AGAM|nr:hypothetical protein FIBSPDRAFT_961317 [Fibularhizoctonia sp. CBS 109695]